MITKDFLRTATVEEFLDLLQVVEFEAWKDGFRILWTAKDIGFGELTFYIKDAKTAMDTEYMPQNFVEACLVKLARSAKRAAGCSHPD